MSRNSKEQQKKDRPIEELVENDEAVNDLAEELSSAALESDISEGESSEEVSREDLIEQLQSALQQIDEMKDGYIRAKAEVENIQRRSQNEMISARKFAIEAFAQELLSVADSLDQAARVEMDDSKNDAVVKMKEGLALTLKQFNKVMEKFGVTAVEAEQGVKFDPDLHQAISMVPSNEVEPDHILTIMQKGYSLKDRLLRPAMVVIAKSAEK